MNLPVAIGGYRIVRELGRGGMGVVYEAVDGRLGRRVALKQLLEERAAPDDLRRFEREAELLARVRHKGLVAVHELGRSPAGPYMVMELLEGTSLEQVSARGPLAPQQAAAIARAVADALAALHAQGIVHRDIKPANIHLRDDGSPVLLDLGIAHDREGERLTRTGALLGSPAYMAPEQAEGVSSRLLDGRVDVYGLGATLLTLLSGRYPFSATSYPELLKRVLTAEPEWPREAPPPLQAVVARAMAKAPEGRYGSAEELREDLDRFLGGRPVLGGAPPRRRRRALAAALATALAALSIAGGLALSAVRGASASSAGPAPGKQPTLEAPARPAPERRELEPLPEKVPTTVELREEVPVCIFPRDANYHGRFLGSEQRVLVLREGLPSSLQVVDLGPRGPVPRPEEPLPLELGPAWLLAVGDGLIVVGGDQAPTATPQLLCFALEPDGALRRLPPLLLPSRPYALAFAPDGHTLAVGDRAGDIALWELRSSEQPRLLRRWAQGAIEGADVEQAVVGSLAFDRGGHRLLSAALISGVVDGQRPLEADSLARAIGGWRCWEVPAAAGSGAPPCTEGILRLDALCAAAALTDGEFLVGTGGYQLVTVTPGRPGEEAVAWSGEAIPPERGKPFDTAHQESVRAVAVAARPRLVVTVSGQSSGDNQGGELRAWDPDRRRQIGAERLRQPGGSEAPYGLYDVDLSPSGRYLLVSGVGHGVRRYTLSCSFD